MLHQLLIYPGAGQAGVLDLNNYETPAVLLADGNGPHTFSALQLAPITGHLLELGHASLPDGQTNPAQQGLEAPVRSCCSLLASACVS